MTLQEYIQYAIQKRYLSDIEWYYSMFTIPVETTKYIYIDKNKYFLIIDNDKIPIIMNDNGTIFKSSDKFTINNNMFKNVSKDTKTTLGNIIINYLLIETPFGDKIPFKENIDIGKLHKNVIIKKLSDKDSKDTFTVSEYQKFCTSILLVRALANVFMISSSEKAITPPKGIKEYKKERIKWYKEKYGEDVFKDKVMVAKLEDDLKAYDKEYLKDDPMLGVSLNKKILNNSRKKRFLMVGSEGGITEKEDAVMVENALIEGYPKDKEQIASMFNNARGGSYSRGKETQVSGVISDKLVRGLTGFTVEKDDCGVTYGLMLHVNENNYSYLIGRYMIKNKKSVLIENESMAKELIGSDIELRSMLYCKEKKISFCKKCTGSYLSAKKNLIALSSLELGASAMSANLKKMHSSELNLITLSIDDLIH